MIDESDTSLEKECFFQIQAKKLRKKFEKRRINFYDCKDINAAQKTIQEILIKFITEESLQSVAFSDSVTLHQLAIYDMVNKLSKEYLIDINNPFERYTDGKLKAYGEQPEGKLNIPKTDYLDLQKKWLESIRSTLLSDILIIGANAITFNGDIVSTDGAGNRVSAMIFGPRKVIVVVGRNKLVADIDQAIQRNRNVAAPLNYLRHNLKHHNRYDTPCLETGYCIDCDHPRRACLNTVIISGAVEANKDRLHLVFINEDLGL